MNMGEKTGMGSRSGHVAVMFGDKKIFVFGGFTGEIVLNDVWVFDVANSQWTEVMRSENLLSQEAGPEDDPDQPPLPQT